jgi:hypothetical protein
VNSIHYGESCLNVSHGFCLFASLEMSCPPQGFLEESFLGAAKAALVDGGVLVINVVSRAAGAHSSSAAKLQKVNLQKQYIKLKHSSLSPASQML